MSISTNDRDDVIALNGERATNSESSSEVSSPLVLRLSVDDRRPSGAALEPKLG